MIEIAMNFKPGIVSTMGLPEKVPVHHRDGTWSGQGEDTEKNFVRQYRMSLWDTLKP